MSEKKRERLTGYAFSLPAFLFMIALIGFPVVYNWYISFHNMTSRTFNAGKVAFNGNHHTDRSEFYHSFF